MPQKGLLPVESRIIHTKFWDDDFILELETAAKLAFIYLITNRRINLLGCYELAHRLICLDTGISSEEVTRFKLLFEEAGKIRFFKSWVHVVNAPRYQTYSGEKNDAAKRQQLDKLPDDVREWYDQKGVKIAPAKPKTNGHTLAFDETVPPIRLSPQFLSDMPDDEVAILVEMTGRSPEAVRFHASKAATYLSSKGQKPANYQSYMVSWLLSKFNQENSPTREVKNVTL